MTVVSLGSRQSGVAQQVQLRQLSKTLSSKKAKTIFTLLRAQGQTRQNIGHLGNCEIGAHTAISSYRWIGLCGERAIFAEFLWDTMCGSH
jgi:hypothetical protein